MNMGLHAHDRECSSALRRPGVLVACSSVSGGRLLTTNLGERLGSARRLLACCADSSGGVGRAGCDGVAASLGGIGAMGAENCRALPARLRGDAKAVAAAVAAAEGRCFRLRRGESGERKSSVVSRRCGWPSSESSLFWCSGAGATAGTDTDAGGVATAGGPRILARSRDAECGEAAECGERSAGRVSVSSGALFTPSIPVRL